MASGHRVRRGALPLRRIALVALSLIVSANARLLAQDVLCEITNTEVHSLKFVGNTTFSDDELSSRVITTPSSTTRRLLASLHIPWGGAKRCYPDVGLKPDVDSLKLFYQVNGFYDTKVDTVVTPSGRDAVDVTFRIQEGQPLVLDTLSITGLDGVPTRDELLRRIPLHIGERVGRANLATAYDTLVTALRNSGYPHADALRQFDTHIAQHRAEVGLTVMPGAFARFGTIAVRRVGPDSSRNPSIDSAVVVKDLLRFKSGSPYSDTAIVTTSQFLYGLGTYRHVGISLDTAWQHGDSVADVNVDLREDYMQQFDLDEGWGTLDCFRVNTQYTNKNFQGVARRLTLTARASKLGYGDIRGWHSDFARQNLCWSQLLSADSIGSSKVNGYLGTTITFPTLFGTRWIPSYSFYTERRGQYKSYLRTTDFGGSASAATEWWRIPLRIGYTLEHGNVLAEPAVLCGVFNRCTPAEREDVQARKLFGVASIAFQNTRTDNIVSPTKGYAWATEFRMSNPATASDVSLTFNKLTGDASVFQSLGRRAVFAGRLRAGYIGGGQESDGARLPPPQERLYAGGPSSVRGFNQNELGPQVYLLDLDAITVDTVDTGPGTVVETWVSKGKRQNRTIPSGGNALLVANAEVRFRGGFLPADLELAPFVDAG
jgi:outer membrane protein assembly factor BamA